MWLVPAVEKFPRTQKFLLGDRIQTTALDVLECLIEATYTRDRKGQLARANLGIEKLRFFFRLAVAVSHSSTSSAVVWMRSPSKNFWVCGNFSTAGTSHIKNWKWASTARPDLGRCRS